MNLETLLPFIEEASELVLLSDEGIEYQIHPAAGRAWTEMKHAAQVDGIQINLVSAFRSVARQTEIIEKKRKSGVPDSIIYQYSAPPGHSEHHSGRAVDIGTVGSKPLTEAFENTEAFAWLLARAHEFGFHMSYPRGNRFGIAYEPWHWFYRRDTATTPLPTCR